MCGSSPKANERLLKCHSEDCKNGNFFHLNCLDYKRMSNNSQTTWMCSKLTAKHLKKPNIYIHIIIYLDIITLVQD